MFKKINFLKVQLLAFTVEDLFVKNVFFSGPINIQISSWLNTMNVLINKHMYLLGHPKEGLYNSAEQKNSVCSSCLDQSYNRLIPF